MYMRRKRRGLLARLTARVAIACMAVVGVLAFTAPSASAFVACPTGGNTAGGVDEWETTWPTTGADPKGVTMCEGVGGIFSDTRGWLQIVDLSDGAKIRLLGDREPTGPESSPFETDTIFRKRTADAWYSWIQSLDPGVGDNWAYTQPDADLLFSTTNASFFKDSDNDNDTTVPFPRWTWGVADSFGVSYRDSDSDYDAPKRYLAIGTPDPWDYPTQQVKVGYFPTNYDYNDLNDYIQHVGGDPYAYDTVDATVSFAPDHQVGDSSRRNYLGVYGDIVYLFTSDDDYTNQEAINIMNEIQPGMDLIQLDGGGSAQVYSEYGEMDSSIPIFDREVADVLAIYKAD